MLQHSLLFFAPATYLFIACLVNDLANAQDIADYGDHDLTEIVTSHDGKPVVDMKIVDAVLDDLRLHAIGYPPRFAHDDDKRRACSDAEKMAHFFDVIAPTPDVDTAMLFRAATLYAIAHNLDLEGNAEKADKCFERLVKREPENRKFRLYFGNFLAGSARSDLAMPHLKKAVALGDDNAMFSLAMAYLALGEEAAAKGELKAILEIHPSNQHAANLLKAIETGNFGIENTQPEQKDDTDSLESLIEEADRVLKKSITDYISAADEAGVVFKAASRLFKEGKNKDSEHYFTKGLQLSPWDMENQLEYAKVLSALGKSEKAKSVARIVLQTSEKQYLLEESAGLVGEQLPRHINLFPQKLKEAKVICFVKIGPVDDWIIQESGKQLSDKLGIPVFIHSKHLPLPLPHRSSYERWSKFLKKDIAWDHPYVIKQMKDIGIKSEEKATSDQTLELIARIYVAQGRDDLKLSFGELKQQMKERDKQWDVGRLLDTLLLDYPFNSNIVYVGVTASDIYSDDNNYLFGTALTGKHYCIYSYHRYTAWFNSERENKKRLLERILKQLLSSVGFALGVERPTDPRSARSYPSSLEDHDSKGAWLSLECIKGFEKVLGHPLPERTKEESNKGLNSDH